MCMKSNNTTVTTISMMGVNGLYFVLGANYRVLCTKYGMKDVQMRKKLVENVNK